MLDELLQSSSDEHVIVQRQSVLPEQQRHIVPEGQLAHEPAPPVPPPPPVPPLPPSPPLPVTTSQYSMRASESER